MTYHVKTVDPIAHSIQVDSKGRAFVYCPVRVNTQACDMHKLLKLMGSGAFLDGKTPETGDYTAHLVRSKRVTTKRLSHHASYPSYDSWIDIQLTSSNKEH